MSLHQKGNQQKIVNVIRMNDGVSRTEISKYLDLSLPSVSKHIDHLIEQRIIYEDGFDSSSGGRRPIVLRYNYKLKIVMLLKITDNSINYKVAYLDGSVLFSETEIIDLNKLSFADLLSKIDSSVVKVFDLFEQLDLITVTLNCTVKKDGTVLNSNIGVLNGVNLSMSIYTKTRIHCIVKNDLDSMLVGKVSSLDTSFDVVTYMTFNQSDIDSRHYLYGGVHHGNHNLSGKLNYLAKTSILPDGYSDWSQLSDSINEDVALLQKIYEEVAGKLFSAIENIYFTIDPERLYIGGNNPILSEKFVEYLSKYVIRKLMIDVEIEYCNESEYVETMGMLEYAIAHFEKHLF